MLNGKEISKEELEEVLLEGQIFPRFVMLILKDVDLPIQRKTSLINACESLSSRSEKLSKELFNFGGEEVDRLMAEAAVSISLRAVASPPGEA
tara:strand:- start:13502 stop:13780 length:279 start_codon:yes stop_codon:yes gene_type:complete